MRPGVLPAPRTPPFPLRPAFPFAPPVPFPVLPPVPFPADGDTGADHPPTGPFPIRLDLAGSGRIPPVVRPGGRITVT
ncbi:hypothetical protein Slala04_15510 [Streptomyces lavendulae subsp. lavendulae]|nr:hypothetical protein Slala04_15510 [Streptomyces lavendulae subsp. lavendulae]